MQNYVDLKPHIYTHLGLPYPGLDINLLGGFESVARNPRPIEPGVKPRQVNVTPSSGYISKDGKHLTQFQDRDPLPRIFPPGHAIEVSKLLAQVNLLRLVPSKGAPGFHVYVEGAITAWENGSEMTYARDLEIWEVQTAEYKAEIAAWELNEDLALFVEGFLAMSPGPFGRTDAFLCKEVDRYGAAWDVMVKAASSKA